MADGFQHISLGPWSIILLFPRLPVLLLVLYRQAAPWPIFLRKTLESVVALNFSSNWWNWSWSYGWYTLPALVYSKSLPVSVTSSEVMLAYLAVWPQLHSRWLWPWESYTSSQSRVGTRIWSQLKQSHEVLTRQRQAKWVIWLLYLFAAFSK